MMSYSWPQDRRPGASHAPQGSCSPVHTGFRALGVQGLGDRIRVVLKKLKRTGTIKWTRRVGSLMKMLILNYGVVYGYAGAYYPHDGEYHGTSMTTGVDLAGLSHMMAEIKKFSMATVYYSSIIPRVSRSP